MWLAGSWLWAAAEGDAMASNNLTLLLHMVL
jgi:hypothetical protein